MTDVLIRNVPDDDLARIDERAARLGLSRGEYLRRQISRDAALGAEALTVEDLQLFSERSRDLRDTEVMRAAWS